MSFRTVSDYVADLREKKISSVELVDEAIERIEKLDGALNAVVVRDFDRAREAAKNADEAIAAGEEKPLLGVPMTVKESFNVAGLPTTWGIEGTAGIPVTRDAVTVQRLKDAGAVILGKTNVPSLLQDWQSYNSIYGTTNNPWDVKRSPGGSSGGAAASLAAGYVPLELGSDIGGSLRVPASFCGVFAHKPSLNLVPRRGHTPPGAPEMEVLSFVDLGVAGPMGRCVDDIRFGLDILGGPDVVEGTGYKLDMSETRHKSLKDFKVLVLDNHPLMPTMDIVKKAVVDFSDKLEGAGCQIGTGSQLLPDLALIGRTYIQLLMSVFSADMPDEVYLRHVEKARELSDGQDDLSSMTTRGIAMTHRDWIRTDRIRTSLANQWRAFFREWDVIVCPAMHTAALEHDHSKISKRDIEINGDICNYNHMSMWSSIATLTGQPSTAMPVGVYDGLPVGVQVIGPYLEDYTTLEFARLAEQEFGGFVAPSGY